MSPEELVRGSAWMYQRLFSHASIWRRRPADRRAVPAYLTMSYLYKRSNLGWRRLIRHRLTRAAWWPLVEWTRRQHLRFRERLERLPISGAPLATPARFARTRPVVSAGV